MHAAVVERAELEADLQRVIERDELVLRYLPVVALESAAMTGIETLVRWRHPERGLSACRLGAADLTADVAAALGLSGLEPSSLVLEITETALMRDVDETIALPGARRRRDVLLSGLVPMGVQRAARMDRVAVHPTGDGR